MNINGNAQSFCTLWLESKTETPNLIPQRANKTGSMVDMSFLWIRNTALRKALGIFRVTVLVKILADAVFCLTITFVGTKKDCHKRLNILILLFRSPVTYTFSLAYVNEQPVFPEVIMPWQSRLSCDTVMPWFPYAAVTAPPWMHPTEIALSCWVIPAWWWPFIISFPNTVHYVYLVAATLRRVMSKGGCSFSQEPQQWTS